MSIFNSKQPKIDTNKFSKWLKENYTIFKNKELKFVDLNSERDKNFLVEIDGSNKFVVKISNPAEKKSFLNFFCENFFFTTNKYLLVIFFHVDKNIFRPDFLKPSRLRL